MFFAEPEDKNMMNLQMIEKTEAFLKQRFDAAVYL